MSESSPLQAEPSLGHAAARIFLFFLRLLAAEPRAFKHLVDRRALDAQAPGGLAHVAADKRQDSHGLGGP